MEKTLAAALQKHTTLTKEEADSLAENLAEDLRCAAKEKISKPSRSGPSGWQTWRAKRAAGCEEADDEAEEPAR